MAIIAWIISTAALLAGLALRQDMPFAHADIVGNGLLFAAFLSCPAFWAEKPFGITAKPRIIACVTMLFALPLVLFQP